MKTITFSIKGLLTAVTMIAVGLFALMNASYVWSSVVLSFTLLLLLTALVAIVYQRGESRAFWVGFAIFGWAYFILTHPPLGKSYIRLLPTHAALETLHNSVSLSRVVQIDPEHYLRRAARRPQKSTGEEKVEFANKPKKLPKPASQQGNSGQFRFLTSLPTEHDFDRIGHCLWAWLLAVIGGFMARHFYLAQERSQAAREGASQRAGGR